MMNDEMDLMGVLSLGLYPEKFILRTLRAFLFIKSKFLFPAMRANSSIWRKKSIIWQFLFAQGNGRIELGADINKWFIPEIMILKIRPVT